MTTTYTERDIKKLQARLTAAHKTAAECHEALQSAWDALFKRRKDIKAGIESVQQSDEYGMGEEYPYRWIRADWLDRYTEQKQYLESYLTDYGIRIDWENSALMECCGPSLIINDGYSGQGDIYDQDSRKNIIDADKYRDESGELDESRRNELIEAWMEKNGYFPGVFRQTEHGDIFPVKTTKGKKG